MNFSKILIFSIFAVLISAEKLRFDGYKVYRFFPQTEDQRDLLIKLQDDNIGLDFWSDIGRLNKSVDIMFPPHLQGDLLDSLTNFKKIQTELIFKNVQDLIDQEEKSPRNRNGLDWHSYYGLDEVYQWLHQQIANHSFAHLINIGKTYQGRDLLGIKIEKNPGNPKPIIYVDANIHAREWITGAVCTFMINELLNSNDPEVISLTEYFDWHIVPIANPDGFVHTKVANRMWRKTRSQTSELCHGVDPNRNWDFRWEGLPDGNGGSNDPCSDTYRGPSAFSDPEIQAMANYMENLDNLAFYATIHSAGQYMLLPFGIGPPEDNNDVKTPSHDKWMEICGKAEVAFARRYGTVFSSGTIREVMYFASGNSIDWVQGVSHPDVKLNIAFELRDKGRYGHMLPQEQILPSSLEFMDGMISLVNSVKDELEAEKNN